MQNKTTIQYNCIFSTMAKIKKTDSTKYCQGCRVTETFI